MSRWRPRTYSLHVRITPTFALLVAHLAGCGSTKSAPSSQPDAGVPGPRPIAVGDSPYERDGAFPVGHATFVLDDASRSRSLRVEAWYPAEESARATAATGVPLEQLEPPGARRDQLAALLKSAPPCVRRTAHSAADVPPRSGAAFPLVVFSHCHGCLRFSMSTIAERLASHGIAVLAPDHTGNTVYDALAGTNAPLDKTFLETRAADIRYVIDVAFDASGALPTPLHGRLDASALGVFGHSFGAVTTGRVLDLDPRPKAGLVIAAPIEGFLGPTKMASLHRPLFLLLAQEDNSISEIGNKILRQNFKDGNPPVWLAEVADAGHWSFSDIAGLTPDLMPGCGTAQRQTDVTEEFTYLDNAGARSLAAAYVVAYFRYALVADTAAKTFFLAGHPADLVTVSSRE
jgi:dienelactone hydrolase